MPSPATERHVLVVEDHAPTAKMIVTVLDDVAVPISTSIVSDGKQCLAALRPTDDAMSASGLVLLDLDLPIVDGFDVLEHRNEEPALRRTPIIVLSGTDDRETISRCYEAGANAFISKPDGLDGYTAVAEAVIDFWFSTAEFPELTHDGEGA